MLAAALGWMGTAGTFVAYVMLSRGRLAAESRMYATLNMVGGLLGGTACVLYGAWPSAAANFAWAGLGLHGMVKAFRRVPAAERKVSEARSRAAELEPADDTAAIALG